MLIRCHLASNILLQTAAWCVAVFTTTLPARTIGTIFTRTGHKTSIEVELGHYMTQVLGPYIRIEVTRLPITIWTRNRGYIVKFPLILDHIVRRIAHMGRGLSNKYNIQQLFCYAVAGLLVHFMWGLSFKLACKI